jgi:hypothetical protein
MKCEFLRDCNNNVWFINAKDINIRYNKSKVGLQELGTVKA